MNDSHMADIRAIRPNLRPTQERAYPAPILNIADIVRVETVVDDRGVEIIATQPDLDVLPPSDK